MTQADLNGWIALAAAAAAVALPAMKALAGWVRGSRKESSSLAATLFDESVRMIELQRSDVAGLRKQVEECETDRARIWRVLREHGLVPYAVSRSAEDAREEGSS